MFFQSGILHLPHNNAFQRTLSRATFLLACASSMARFSAAELGRHAALPTLWSSAIVASGPFRWSRNPLYIGLCLDFVGLCLIVNTLWGLFALVPALFVMHFGVILREERYLETKFGEDYLKYCSTVRRYL